MIDFFRSPRPVQDKFVAATRLLAPPAPLLFHRARRTAAWALMAISGLLVFVASVVLVIGWGNVASPLALHPKQVLFADALFFSAAAYCFVHAVAILRAIEALPYRAGTYVFPACVVDASGPMLRVWPVAHADAIERLPAPALGLRMRDGERVVVPASRADDVQRADAALALLRPQLTRALAEDDADMLAELDPLHHARISSPISSTESMRPSAPSWVRFDWAVAALIGVGVGLGLGLVRNLSSDERMYRTAVSAASVPMYQQYLGRGGRHADEVREVLLPRAELSEAQAQGTIEALEAFARSHPASKIRPEVDAAMHDALLGELAKAKSAGTVAALDEFARKYPDAHLDAELNSARHPLYAQAFAAWRQKAPVDAQTSAFVERLLAAAEKAGSTCEVRFRFKPSKTIEDADKRIAKHAAYPGPDALPSHYLTADAMRPREQRVTDAVAARVAAGFPADVLAVRAGEPLAVGAPAPSGVPVLVVDYSPEWSSFNTMATKPRTVFAGLRFDFAASFLLPDGPPVQVAFRSWQGADLWKTRGGGGLTREAYQQKVYDAMIDRAFDEFERKLADAFFR
jgi:hypothetical protein